MRVYLKILIFSFLCFKGFSQGISASGNWTYSVPVNTINEAGSDYTLVPVSASNQTLLNLSNLNRYLTQTFTVLVNKVDSDWNNLLDLQVKRIGTGGLGTNGGTISGGVDYISITNSPQVFFSGSNISVKSINNITLQYRLNGLTVLLPVKTYTTTVVYTISN